MLTTAYVAAGLRRSAKKMSAGDTDQLPVCLNRELTKMERAILDRRHLGIRLHRRRRSQLAHDHHLGPGGDSSYSRPMPPRLALRQGGGIHAPGGTTP